MKIIGNLKNLQTFASLKNGDTFVYCDRLYIKVQDNVNEKYGMVDIETGLLYIYTNTDFGVSLREAELVLK